MDEKFSLTDIAKMITKQLGGDEEVQTRLIRQLRNLAVRKAIEVSETQSGRNTQYISRREAAMTRIKLALLDFGLDATAISQTSQFMNFAVDARLELPPIDGYFPPRGIDAVLLELDNAEAPEWKFIIRTRYFVGTGTRFQVGGFIRADQTDDDETSPLSLSGANADGNILPEGELQTQGEFSIPATEMLRAFFKN